MEHNPLVQLLSPSGQEQYRDTSVRELMDTYTIDFDTLTEYDRETLDIVKESFEIYRRTPEKHWTVTSTSSAKNFFATLLEGKDQEEVVVALLNAKNQVIQHKTIFIGTLSSCMLHPREVFNFVLSYPTANFMIAHNHPSGDPSPSAADSEVTKRLVETGGIVGIKLLDHIIVGADDDHLSMKEENTVRFE